MSAGDAAAAADEMPANDRPQAPPLFTEKNLDRRIWGITLPAVGENLLATVILIVDTIMVAPYGQVSLAAAALARTLLWRITFTFGFIERGTTALVARACGAGDRERISTILAQSIILAVGLGALLTALTVPNAARFLRWMGASEEVVLFGAGYLQVICAVSVARMVWLVSSAGLRGVGNTRSPMIVVFWMNVINVILNYLLIYGKFGFPELRLLGCGIATMIAILFSTAATLWIVLSDRRHFELRLRHFRPNWPIMKSILVIGAPSFVDEIIISSGYLVFTAYIAHLGTAVVAAHMISTSIESLAFMAGAGFAVAASTLVGQSLGMKNPLLARRVFVRTTLFCTVSMACIAAAILVFGGYMVEVFSPDTDEVRRLARILLIIAALEQPMLAVVFTLGGGMRGAGDTLSPMIVSLAGNFAMRIGLCYFLGVTLGFGIYGIYIATAVDWSMRAGLLYWFYRRGRWERLKI